MSETDYEELYRNETGKNTRGRSNSYFEKWYHYEFVYWLIQKLSDKDKLLTAEVSRREAAEARFEAAEKVIGEFIDLEDNEYVESETWVDFIEWQDTITAYNKAVGGGNDISRRIEAFTASAYSK